MFERYTKQGRDAVILAELEARNFGHGHIGTEHLLIGLLEQAHWKTNPGIGGSVLIDLEITIQKIREELEKLLQEKSLFLKVLLTSHQIY